MKNQNKNRKIFANLIFKNQKLKFLISFTCFGVSKCLKSDPRTVINRNWSVSRDKSNHISELCAVKR